MNKSRGQAKVGIPLQQGMEASDAGVDAEVVPFSCTLSNLSVIATHSKRPETILNQAESIALQVTVAFDQSGAIALMPLEIPMSIEFFAKAILKGESIALGIARQCTTAKQFNYTFTVDLPSGFVKTGVKPEAVFQICALLRVGAPNHPALIHGVIEGVTIQTYED